MIPRRKFIQNTAAGLASAALSLPGLRSMAGIDFRDTKTPRLAMQLWTVRHEIEKDLHGTLQKIKSIGFNAVETAFFPDAITIQQAGKALKNAGLKVSSIHCEMPVGKQRDVWTELAEVYECNTMIWHGWPENSEYKTMEGIHHLADTYNEANAFAKSKSMRFGLHNHWWEMTPHANGRLPFAILADWIDKDIFYEVDTYWTKVAGQVPASVVNQLANRTRFLHIKDGPGKTPDDSMVAVGTGSQDFPAIAKAGDLEWMVVEFDKCDSDIFEALGKSFVFMVKNGLAEPKF
jgi:sugar phosphate isomerase/epimerase